MEEKISKQERDILERLKWESIDDILEQSIAERDRKFREIREHSFGDYVTVRVRVRFIEGKICVPDEYGDFEEYATFRRTTMNDSFEFEALAMVEEELGKNPMGETMYQRSLDLNEYRRLLIMKNLFAWSLDIPLEHDYDGWLTDECWNRVANVSAPLLDAFVQQFEVSNVITEEEEKTITKQSVLLFGKNSKGVSEACEAVSKFCTYTNFGEKFNLSIDEIKKLPYREYILLRMMISNETESFKDRMKPISSGRSTSKISTGHGLKPSKGKVMPLPGSRGT